MAIAATTANGSRSRCRIRFALRIEPLQIRKIAVSGAITTAP